MEVDVLYSATYLFLQMYVYLGLSKFNGANFQVRAQKC